MHLAALSLAFHIPPETCKTQTYWQRLKMAAAREQALRRWLADKNRFLATDTQTSLLNWPVRRH